MEDLVIQENVVDVARSTLDKAMRVDIAFPDPCRGNISIKDAAEFWVAIYIPELHFVARGETFCVCTFASSKQTEVWGPFAVF